MADREDCPRCGGTGRVRVSYSFLPTLSDYELCPACKGRGYLRGAAWPRPPATGPNDPGPNDGGEAR